MRTVLAVLAAAVVAFLIYGIVMDSRSVAYYVPITIVLAGVFVALDRSAEFSVPLKWGLVVIAIGNIAGGVLLIGGTPLYEQPLIGSIRYDKLFHAVATGVGAWAATEALDRWGVDRSPALGLAAALVAVGGGAVVEVIEYIGSLVISNNSIGGYTNNMEDLIANLLGALVGAALAYRYMSHRDADRHAGRGHLSGDKPALDDSTP